MSFPDCKSSSCVLLNRTQFFDVSGISDLVFGYVHRDKNSKSERLFDLDVTEYPELLEVSTNMDKLSIMYDVYAKWKVCKSVLLSRSA